MSDALVLHYVFKRYKVVPLFSNSGLHFCLLKIMSMGYYLLINSANIIRELTSFKEDLRGNGVNLI